MGDGTEPIPLLTSTLRQKLQAEVMQCANRKDLNRLTIRIWRTYEGRPQNEKHLAELKTAIVARRAMLNVGSGR